MCRLLLRRARAAGCAAAAVLGVTVGVMGCNHSDSASSDAPPAAGPPAVQVIRPERRAIHRVVEQPGTVQAYEQTQLFARVPGYVSKVHVDIGQKIDGPRFDASGKETRPGQVLAEIAVPELAEEVSQKQALTRQAQAEVVQAEKALAAAAANIETTKAAVVEARAQRDRWQSEAKRIAGLAKQGVVDVQSREETENQSKAAGARVQATEAAVKKAQADRDKAAADVQAAAARVEVARADALRSEAMYAYSKIRAPYDGVVTLRKVSTGDFVQPAVGKGDWLFTVARLDPVRVVIAVPEADAELVKDGTDVQLRVPALPGAGLGGKVARTSWALEQAARTLRTEIDLPNQGGLLRPGMYLSARFSASLPPVWTLPVAAVARQGETTVCFLVGGGKAVRTPVEVGHSDGVRVEVFRRQAPGGAGWQAFTGEEAVAARAAGLGDGQAVQAK